MRKDLIPNCKLVKMTSSTEKCTEILLDDRTSYSVKLQEFPKDSSFSSSSSSSNADSETEEKSTKSHNFCSLLTLFFGFVTCVFGCYVMWATNLFTLMIHQNVIISNNSFRYDSWKAPPVHAFLRVYIFNYTNVAEYESNRQSKLHVQELGPYTYIETWERVDIKFNNNGTASYRDKKSYVFSPEHSKGNESDFIRVPNLPYLATMSFAEKLPMAFGLPLKGLLRNSGAKPFIKLTVNEFLWGYDDRLAKITRDILSFRHDLPFKKFGILAAKNGTQKDIVTIFTGEKDSSKTGIVSNYGGKTSLDFWKTKECNRIDGTDGTIYPPALIHPNSTLYIYSKDLCRKMPLKYVDQYEDKHGIPVMRFRIPETVFASGHVEKKNLCFCTKSYARSECLPSGIFDVGPCAFEAPLVTSLPHFLHGDHVLSKGVTGLNPDVEKHESYIEVDPVMGIPVGGKSKLQLNVIVFGNGVYRNQYIFPITWMDYGIDRLPDDISSMLKTLLSILKIAEFSLSYGFIMCAIFFAAPFLSGCWLYIREYYTKKSEQNQTDSQVFVIEEKR